MSRLWQVVGDIISQAIVLGPFLDGGLDLGINAGAFHEINTPALLQAREHVAKGVAHVLDGSGDDAIHGIDEILIDVAADDVEFFEAHLFAGFFQENHALLHAFSQQNLFVGVHDLKGNARESGAGAKIHQGKGELGQSGQNDGINVVLDGDVTQLEQPGEVIELLLSHQQAIVACELFALGMTDEVDVVIAKDIGQAIARIV